VHGLEHRRGGPIRVDVPRGGPTDPAGDGTPQVGEDVAEEIVGDDHVETVRLLDKVDARSIDMVVPGLHIRIFEGDLVEGALPKVARECEHIGLVYQRQTPSRARPGQVEGISNTTFHAEASVDGTLGGDLGQGALTEEAPFPRVSTFSVLTDHAEIDRDAGPHT
jgi:hypothetical protein